MFIVRLYYKHHAPVQYTFLDGEKAHKAWGTAVAAKDAQQNFTFVDDAGHEAAFSGGELSAVDLIDIAKELAGLVQLEVFTRDTAAILRHRAGLPDPNARPNGAPVEFDDGPPPRPRSQLSGGKFAT